MQETLREYTPEEFSEIMTDLIHETTTPNGAAQVRNIARTMHGVMDESQTMCVKMRIRLKNHFERTLEMRTAIFNREGKPGYGKHFKVKVRRKPARATFERYVKEGPNYAVFHMTKDDLDGVRTSIDLAMM